MFSPGDVVSYIGNQYNHQWVRHSTDGTAVYLTAFVYVGHENWATVKFPDGVHYSYPTKDLILIRKKPQQMTSPEFELDEIHEASELMERLIK